MEADVLQPRQYIPICTILLVVANVIVFMISEISGSSLDTNHMLDMGAMYEPLFIGNHEYYRLITHFFLHFGFDHLLNNMFSLAVLGYVMEPMLGRIKFIFLYFLSGILAGITSIVYNMNIGDEVVSCGASGAIYGLMGALLAYLILAGRRPRKSEIIRFFLFIALSTYSGVMDQGIDGAAHIGGMIAGFIIAAIFCLIKRRRKVTVNYES